MDAVLLQDVYASQLGALPWNIEDYIVAPKGSLVAIQCMDGDGIHVAVLLGQSTVGLTLAPGAVEQVEEPSAYEQTICEPPLPAWSDGISRYLGWRR